jgi:hypothetical protein
MKHLQVTYSNGNTDHWSIPAAETEKEALKGIEKETGNTIQSFQWVVNC